MDGRGQESELEIPELLILTQLKEMMKDLNQPECVWKPRQWMSLICHP